MKSDVKTAKNGQIYVNSLASGNTVKLGKNAVKSGLIIGGVEGDRTPDLMNAIHALSQLSYDPIFICSSYKRTIEQELTLAKSASSVKIQSSFTFELRLAFF